MQTRQRARRRVEAQPASVELEKPKAARSTRRTAAPHTLVAGLGSASVPQQPPTSPEKTRPKPGSIVRDPAARRGAPNGDVRSVSSISGGSDDESGHEDDGDADGGGVDGLSGSSQAPTSAQVGDINAERDEEELQIRVMEQLLPALERTTRDWIESLTKGEFDDPVARKVRNAMRDQFEGLRHSFRESGNTSIFIDWARPGVLHDFVEANRDAATVFARGNIAAALDYMRQTQPDDHPSKQAFLQTLDTSFPTLFQTPNITASYPKLILAIRKCYLVETLASLKRKTDEQVQEAIARIFCGVTDSNYDKSMCEDGPYRSVGGESGDDYRKEYSETAREILACMASSKKKQAVETLRQNISLPQLLRDLENCIIGMHKKLLKDGAESVHLNDFEGLEESDSDYEDDADNIVRLDAADAQPSLHEGKHSFRELETTDDYGRPDAALDEEQVPGEGAQSSREPAAGARAHGMKRAHAAMVADGDDHDGEEEGEGFETDKRIVVQGRYQDPNRPWATRKNPQSGYPAQPAKRLPVPDQPSSAPPKSAPPSSAASAPPPLVPAPTSAQSRVKWSDKDAKILIRIIGDLDPKLAIWATIEKRYMHYFETPRNQQAFRDKARNLKVDFLKYDERLPFRFDRVSLGAKEIASIEACGKNPFRKEADMDEDGMPINTALLF